METIKKHLLICVILGTFCELIDAKGVQLCPKNMEHGNSTCLPTCDDPRQERCSNTSKEEQCVCSKGFLMKGDHCVGEEECGCFVQGEGVIQDRHLVIFNCSKRCSCNANQLTCEDIHCSVNATCSEKEGAHKCVCKKGFVGDGLTCVVASTDCLDLYNAGVNASGVYTIYPTHWVESGFQVHCEMESDGGGWTVIQRRLDGTLDFYRNWASYKHGFGSLTHEFWLGNDKIHALTHQGNFQLRIDILNPQGESVYSLYNSFNISDEKDKYRLSVGTERGNTVGNPFNHNNGQQFSTFDQDNDGTSMYNCAEEHHGGWWYKEDTHTYSSRSDHCWKWVEGNTLTHCGDSNLNGGYHESGIKSIYYWHSEKDPNNPQCGVTRTQMKIRR